MQRVTRRKGFVMALIGALTLLPRIPASAAAQPSEPSAQPSSPVATSAVPSRAEQAAMVLLERGAYYEQQGRRAAALRAYTEAVQLAPTSQRALMALARTRFELADYREAELLYKRLEALGHATDEVVRRLALMAEHRGETQQAERLRARLCWSRPSAAEASDPTQQYRECERLAAAYVQQKQYLAALQIWRFIRSRGLSPDAASEVNVQVAALEVLAAELDPVRAGKSDYGWTRHLLYRISRDAAR